MSERARDVDASAVGARLRVLSEGGARAFDPIAHAFAERLLERGAALGGRAGARLVARALQRTELLERALADAKGRGLEAGDASQASRAARRRAIAPVRRETGREAWVARLSATARARGLTLPAAEADTVSALAASLLDASRDELSAMLLARRAWSEVPSNAGPYNPQAIAARTLARLSTSAPAYLTALVAWLDELSPLLSLPPPSAPSARASQPPGRRKGTRPPRA